MVVRAVDDGSEAATSRENGSGSKVPSDRQEEILRAYAWTGNAAEVGRQLKTNEGNVRRLGRLVKIRLVNEMESDHPMHHPFHIHGAGRFLVLSRDAEPESNLVWKDTVLVRAGQTVDIMLDVSNPGLWMAHCHIAEHAQSGMMFSFDVARA